MKRDNYHLRKSTTADADKIWEVLQQAIEQRRLDGSQQWQNGYPNQQTVDDDIALENSYVFLNNNNVVACAVIIFGEDPNYKTIDGKWLTDAEYAAIHRVATSNDFKSKGVATALFFEIETFCKSRTTPSIRVDTNFDNVPMLRILDKLDYHYCGEIFFNNAFRKAFEKILE
jgi:GNAT superfamily N-acetyltransferase